MTLSASAVAKLLSRETDEAFLLLLTFDHPDMQAPIRVCNEGLEVWRLGGATAMADSQTNLSANNGSLSTSATFRRGYLGGALQRYDFISPSTATIADRTAYSGLTNFTLECWMRLRELGDAGSFHIAMTKTTAPSDRMFLLLTRPDPNRERLLYSHGDGTGFNDTDLFDMTIDRWHHVAVVKSGDNFSFWVDGAAAPLNPTKTIIGAVTGNTAPWQIHAGSDNAEIDIDELRLWNVARSQAQIVATMESELAGDESGLIGYWKMDDGDRFASFPFQLDLPHEAPNEMPRARLRIDNVHRDIVGGLRLLAGTARGPDVLMELIAASDPDLVEHSWPNFRLRSADYDLLYVTGELMLDLEELEPFPGDSITPETSPGTFA